MGSDFTAALPLLVGAAVAAAVAFVEEDDAGATGAALVPEDAPVSFAASGSFEVGKVPSEYSVSSLSYDSPNSPSSLPYKSKHQASVSAQASGDSAPVSHVPPYKSSAVDILFPRNESPVRGEVSRTESQREKKSRGRE